MCLFIHAWLLIGSFMCRPGADNCSCCEFMVAMAVLCLEWGLGIPSPHLSALLFFLPLFLWCFVVVSLSCLGLSIWVSLILCTLSSYESAFTALHFREKLLQLRIKVAFVYRYRQKYLEDSLTLSSYLNHNSKYPIRASYFHGHGFLSRFTVPDIGSLLLRKPSIKVEWLVNSMTIVPLVHKWALLPGRLVV